MSAAASAEPDLAALAQKLKSANDRERREAVQAIAKEATLDAWSLVLDALHDPDAMVADEAQLQLGKLADPSFGKELFGKRGLGSGDDLLQRRVAEALGRMPVSIDAGGLGKHLSDKDPEVRRMLLWSIDRLAAADRVDDKARKYLETAVRGVRKKDKDPDVRAAALLAEQNLLRIGQEKMEAGVTTLELGLEGMKDDAVEVQCAAIQAMARWDPKTALEALASWIQHPNPHVRREMVDLLAQTANRTAAQNLATVLEIEKDQRLAWTIVDRLEKLSGLAGGRDASFWKEWANNLSEDWKPGAKSSKESSKRAFDTGTAVFMGLPVLSQRVAILIDFSSSIWETRPNGKTRKEVLALELKRALETLPANTSFNLVPYTAEPMPWEKKLVPASPANVARALKYYEDCKARGPGDFWTAAWKVAADPEVDTLLLLSDGAPSGGHLWNLELIRDLFAERNRFRHLVVDALIVDAQLFLQERWKEICAQSGGRMLAIALE